MKRFIILLTVGLLCFGLGWWTNEMRNFGNGIKAEAKRNDSLKQTNPFFMNDKCRPQLTTKLFHSPNNVTGGFSSKTLVLNKTGNMFLIDSTAVEKGETKSGGIYEWKADTTAIGYWCVKEKLIFCRFFNDRAFIENTFILNKYKTKGLTMRNYPTVVTFPVETDTLFIGGIPCI